MVKRGRPKLSQDITYHCRNCGKEFTRPAWYTDSTTYCSRVCYHAWRKGKPAPWAEIPHEFTACARCGRNFWVRGRERRERQRYCSQRCAGTSKYPIPAELSVPDAAYIAGFLDGEGTIQWLKNNTTCRVSIYQCDEAVIRWIAEVTGTGFVHSREPNGRNLVKQAKFKTGWVWQLYGRNALLFLQQLVPYMHVKRAKAEEVIAQLLD